MIRNDRKIAVAVLVVGVLALVGIWLTANDEPPVTEPVAVGQADGQADTIRHHHTRGPIQYATTDYQPERFPFDPNTADSTQLLRLGLQPWQVRNIYRYRSRGGVYRRKEDFARLYGLTVKQYRELAPYIRISKDYQPAAALFAGKQQHETFERDTVQYPVKIKDGEYIVLNTADTTQLKQVPGIGSFYAKEIVRHGQWLGGYVSIDQLDEIEGFPQDAKKYFVIDHPTPQKLNINRLTLQQLRRHPYINYYRAKTITDYRRLHGDITDLNDLRFSRDFPPDIIERLRPYVAY